MKRVHSFVPSTPILDNIGFYRFHQLFGDIEGVHVVFDYLIIGGKDDAEHDSILKLV